MKESPAVKVPTLCVLTVSISHLPGGQILLIDFCYFAHAGCRDGFIFGIKDHFFLFSLYQIDTYYDKQDRKCYLRYLLNERIDVIPVVFRDDSAPAGLYD